MCVRNRKSQREEVMTLPVKYNLTVGGGVFWFALEISGGDLKRPIHTQAKTEHEIYEMAREAVAFATQVDPSELKAIFNTHWEDGAAQMVASVPQWVDSGIQKALAPPKPVKASRDRYPYTYAYDFLRAHAADFGLPDWVDSRSACAAWLREAFSGGSADIEEDPAFQVTLKRLADAYLKEHNMVLPH